MARARFSPRTSSPPGSRALSRRSFLALTGGAVLLAACGDGTDEASTSDDGHDHEHTGADAGTRTEVGDFTDASAGLVSSDLHVDPEPQRLAVAVLAREGYASGGEARVAVLPPDAPEDADPEWTEPAFHGEGLPERRGIYVVMPVLDVAGTWRGRLEYDGERSDFFFTVNEQAQMPAIGEAAPRVPSPTLADPRGVDPICTLDPPCPFHAVSLDEVVGHRPVVVQFSTPARCQSRYCGPVLEILVDEAAGLDDVAVVHVEIFRDPTSDDVVDTIGPGGWDLLSEPWLYAIAPDGTIVDRLDGAFDAGETRALIERLRAASA